MSYQPEISCYMHLVNYLGSMFEEFGWGVNKRVESHDGEEMADLIVSNTFQQEPVRIGIVCKNFYDSCSRGREFAKVHERIQDGKHGTYIDNPIDLWAFCPYFNDTSDGSWPSASFRLMREYLCYHKIGIIDLDTATVFIDYNYSRSHMKVPAFSRSRYDNELDDFDKGFDPVKLKSERVVSKDR